jgi:hypothetical protein
MITQIATEEARSQANEKKQLALLLLREISLEKDQLMSEAAQLVNEHFADIGSGNILKAAQLKNLEGVAFSSINAGEVIKFINNQAKKELDKKPEKQGWLYKELNKNLLAKIEQITGRFPGRATGTPGRKDIIIESVHTRAAKPPAISEGAVNNFFTKDREQDIQMELLREFISYFATFYVLKAKESSGQEIKEEG